MNNFKQALDLSMGKNDANAKTLREYFKILLSKLWADADDFNGKRPFGNGSWQFDIYAMLIGNGFISGTLDEDGYVSDFDSKEADIYIQKLISFIFEEK